MEQYSSVNTGKPRGSCALEEGSAAVMAVTAAPLGQALAMRGFQAGELAAIGREQNSSPSVVKELPLRLIRRVSQFH